MKKIRNVIFTALVILSIGCANTTVTDETVDMQDEVVDTYNEIRVIPDVILAIDTQKKAFELYEKHMSNGTGDTFELDDDLTLLLLSKDGEKVSSETSHYESLLQQFFDDADVSEAARIHLVDAISGREGSILRLRTNHHDELSYLVYKLGTDKKKNLFEIGMAYYHSSFRTYDGDFQDRVKALEWAKMSAHMGSVTAALSAGDMVRYGDGVPVDEQMAYELYSLAHSTKPSVFTYERLGYCYLYGIGVAIDRQKAFDYFLKCTFEEHIPGLFMLSEFTEYLEIDLTALYKAFISNIWSGDNHGDLTMSNYDYDYHALNNARRDSIKILSDIWESEPHPIVQPNANFPEKFVDELMKVAHTQTYGAFIDEYILPANRTHEDAHRFNIYITDDKLGWSSVEQEAISQMGSKYYPFYEYDIDGCGVDEIAVYILGSVGGSTANNYYAIFKENNDGLYEFFSISPLTYTRDNMHIVSYDDKIYFVYNLHDETGNEPHDIFAYTIDANGRGHKLSITIKDYSPRHIFTYIDTAYTSDYDELFSNVDKQVETALQDARHQRIYSPEGEIQLVLQPDDDLWDNRYTDRLAESYYGPPQDVFFVADIENNGIENVIHKGRSWDHWKSFIYQSWFEVYKNRKDFDNGTVALRKPEFIDRYHGLQSAGNLHDMLPIGNTVSQFWTHEYDGVTYCVTLNRYGWYKLIYALQIFVIQNGEPQIVSQSLFFDEAQKIDLLFLY
ncbi:MAG: sel1 repeat family protein [Lachnospiraceae bacterium]|jgi:hypothetical protein|nr:sel1 repeat family protein [Lachnospiraceae bacterium]